MYLILDQGGQSSRVALFDGDGSLLKLCQREVATMRPQPGWVEQDPGQLLASLQQCLAEITLPANRQISAALVTQRSSLVCWDRISGEPLSPVLSWQDTRASDELDQLQLDSASIRLRTGLFPSAHFGASKMRWCLQNIPAVAAAAAEKRLCIAPLSSFLLFHLLLNKPYQVDATNAQRTMLYNLKEDGWDQQLLQKFGIEEQLLPVIEDNFSQWGSLPVGARTVDMRFVSGDQSAAFSALMGDRQDAAVVNVGTGAFIGMRLQQGQQAPTKLLNTLLLAEKDQNIFIAEGTINGAGSALHNIAEQLGIDVGLAFKPADQQLQKSLPLFLNGVGGLAAPFWQPEFQSRFIGTGDKQQKLLAVLESIAFLIYCNFQQIEQLDNAITQIRIGGGLAQSDGLCQMLANLCQLPVHRPELAETTAYGAAWLLAGKSQWLQPENIFQADENSKETNNRYTRWINAMQQL